MKRSSIESNDSVTARDTFCPLLAGVAGCASCGVGGARACAGCVDWANKPSKLIGVASCASYGVGGARACAACVDWANKSSKWIGVAFDDPLPFICPEEMPKGRPKGCPKGCSKGCSRDAQGTICNANRRKFQVSNVRGSTEALCVVWLFRKNVFLWAAVRARAAWMIDLPCIGLCVLTTCGCYV